MYFSDDLQLSLDLANEGDDESSNEIKQEEFKSMLEGLVKKSGAMNDIKKSKGDGDINNIKKNKITHQFFSGSKLDGKHIIRDEILHVSVPLLHHLFPFKFIRTIFDCLIIRYFFNFLSSNIPFLIILSLSSLTLSFCKYLTSILISVIYSHYCYYW